MPHLGEIWYFERSLAAPLARPLRRRYALRALPRPSRGRTTVLPSSGETRVVCLADVAGSDLPLLRRLASREPRIRLIGISRNGANREPAAGCFATLPSKAGSTLVRTTVAAAFDNIELAQRERAARAEVKRTEHELEELNRIGVALSETRDVSALLNMILSKARQITRAPMHSTRVPGNANFGSSSPRTIAFSFPSRNLSFRCVKIPWLVVRQCAGKLSTLPMPITFRVAAHITSTTGTTRKQATGRVPCSLFR
jgi:hypothetical protein